MTEKHVTSMRIINMQSAAYSDGSASLINCTFATPTDSARIVGDGTLQNPLHVGPTPNAIDLTLAPSDQFLRDVLTTACEGGSNYWAGVKCLDTVEGPYGREWARVRVWDCEDDDSDRFEVGYDELRDGIRRILAGDMTDKASHAQVANHYRAALFLALVSEPGGDSGNVDGDLADCILQCAAMGCIVYG
ncbi:hypothetical protein D3C87_687330 [compost metagenome]